MSSIYELLEKLAKRRPRDNSNRKAANDGAAALIAQLDEVARRDHQGTFMIMAFRSNWRVTIGALNPTNAEEYNFEQVPRMAEGKTLETAITAALKIHNELCAGESVTGGACQERGMVCASCHGCGGAPASCWICDREVCALCVDEHVVFDHQELTVVQHALREETARARGQRMHKALAAAKDSAR